MCMYSQKARWESNTNLTSQAINLQSLILALCGTATTTTNLASNLFAIKIVKVRMYGPAVVSSSTSTINFEWFEPASSAPGVKPTSWSSGSLGTAFGSYLEFRPPKKTMWDNWVTVSNPGNITCFLVTGPAGTCFELEFHAYLENADASLNVNTFTGLIAGDNYRTGLDGAPKASSTWNVVGYRAA